MIRVLVADDQALVRDGIATVLSLADEIEVVGEAADGAEAVERACALQPDIVLMDLRMPGIDGAEATRLLAERAPAVRVLVLTTYADDASIGGALAAGATGFLTKDAGREEIVAAVRAAAAGHTPLDPRVAARVIAGLPEAAPRPEPLRDRFPSLTAREAEVLQLIGDGRTNPEIAAQLFVGVSTVKTHVNAIFAKLGAADRREAVRMARGE